MAGGWSCASHISTVEQAFICRLSCFLDCTMGMLLTRLVEHKVDLKSQKPLFSNEGFQV